MLQFKIAWYCSDRSYSTIERIIIYRSNPTQMRLKPHGDKLSILSKYHKTVIKACVWKEKKKKKKKKKGGDPPRQQEPVPLHQVGQLVQQTAPAGRVHSPPRRASLPGRLGCLHGFVHIVLHRRSEGNRAGRIRTQAYPIRSQQHVRKDKQVNIYYILIYINIYILYIKKKKNFECTTCPQNDYLKVLVFNSRFYLQKNSTCGVCSLMTDIYRTTYVVILRGIRKTAV